MGPYSSHGKCGLQRFVSKKKIWVGFLFALWPTAKMLGDRWAYGLALLLLAFPVGVYKAPNILNQWGVLPNTLKLPSDKLRCFLRFALIQGVGLGVYVGIYGAGLTWYGAQWTLPLLLAFVVIQSWLFLAPIVPANLVVLEGAGIWCFTQQGIAPEIALAVIALMRVSLLAELLVLAPWARMALPSWSELKNSQTMPRRED